MTLPWRAEDKWGVLSPKLLLQAVVSGLPGSSVSGMKIAWCASAVSVLSLAGSRPNLLPEQHLSSILFGDTMVPNIE